MRAPILDCRSGKCQGQRKIFFRTVSAEPAALGSLGLKSSRFVCTALASTLMMTAGYANAGPGIFINDGNDDGCIVTSDESSKKRAVLSD